MRQGNMLTAQKGKNWDPAASEVCSCAESAEKSTNQITVSDLATPVTLCAGRRSRRA